jgi:hypothetical protein
MKPAFRWWMYPLAPILTPFLAALMVLSVVVWTATFVFVVMPVCIFCWFWEVEEPKWFDRFWPVSSV